MRRDSVEIKFSARENGAVWIEGDDSAVQLGLADSFDLRYWLATIFVLLFKFTPLAVHFGTHVSRECVDHRCAHAMQTS